MLIVRLLYQHTFITHKNGDAAGPRVSDKFELRNQGETVSQQYPLVVALLFLKSFQSNIAKSQSQQKLPLESISFEA